MNYEKDVKIDPDALDIECLNQPSLMFRYAKYEAQGKRALDMAELAFEIEKAKIETEIRKDPHKHGIPETIKITEAVIRNTLIQTEEFQIANTTLLNAREDHAFARAGVKAIDARKSALETLVKLHGQSYFAGPSIPRDLAEEWQKKETEPKVRMKRTTKPE